jgi:hypothetical protein
MSPSDVTMPVWNEKHLRAATRAAGVALWSWNVDTDAVTMDEPAYDLWEVSKDEQNITFEILSKNIHPADLERVRSAFAAMPFKVPESLFDTAHFSEIVRKRGEVKVARTVFTPT